MERALLASQDMGMPAPASPVAGGTPRAVRLSPAASATPRLSLRVGAGKAAGCAAAPSCRPARKGGLKQAEVRMTAAGPIVVMPAWAEFTILGAVVGSWIAAAYLGPLYFRSPATGEIGYVLASVPFFFLLMALEVLIQHLSGLPSPAAKYSLADSWSSIAAGMVQRLFKAVIYKPLQISILPFLAYSYVWQHYALVRIPEDSALALVASFIVVDFLYYWAHRFGHEWSLFWAGHVVHHESDHYNLSTALRQSWWQLVFDAVIMLASGLIFPPTMFVFSHNWTTIYQYWVHTCCVRRLGPIEWILQTPSSHRVHHHRALHKNFSGVFIIWDRLFGTFLDEYEYLERKADGTLPERPPEVVAAQDAGEVCLFGVTKAPDTFTEAITQTHYAKDMWARLRRARSLSQVLRILVRGPGYHTSTAKRNLLPPSVHSTRIRRRSHVPRPAKLYLLVHFVFVLLMSLGILAELASFQAALVLCAALLSTLYVQGLLFDANPVAPSIEAARCLAVSAACAYLAATPASLAALPFAPSVAAITAIGLLHAISAAFAYFSPSSVCASSVTVKA